MRYLLVAVVVMIGLFVCTQTILADAPNNLDFIFLIDVSGSMEFDFDGLHPVPLAQQRISYVKPALEALSTFLDSVYTSSAPFTNVSTVRFAFAIFPGDAPDRVSWKVGTATSLTSWDKTTFDDTASSLTTRWAGTPIKTALNAADDLWAADDPGASAGKVIFLLTDGKSYGESTEVLDLSPDIEVGVVMIGTGSETDPGFLEGLCEGSEPCVQTFSAGEDASPITALFIKTLFGSAVLDWVTLTDPTLVMTSEDVATFDIDVTGYDEQLFFVTTWQTPRDEDRVLFAIDAPGVTLTPGTSPAGVTYTEGATYAIYSASPTFVEAHPGTWQIRIDGSPLPPRTRQLTTYMAGGSSRLRVNQHSKVPNVLVTGDALPLAFQVIAGDVVVSDARMRAEISMPSQSTGNWFAENKLTQDEMKLVLSEKYPGHVEDAFRKSYFLRTSKKIDPPGRTTVTIDLLDDGEHGDAAAADGIFGNSLPSVTTPGRYKVHLFVEGHTPEGAHFTREHVQNYLVEPKIEGKWGNSGLNVTFLADTDRGAQYDVTFTLRDDLGNHVRPGQGDDVRFDVSGGRVVGDIRDDLQGGYIQRIEVDAGVGAPALEVSYRDARFPPRELPEAVRCGFGVAALVGYLVSDDALGIDDAVTYELRLRRCVVPRLELDGGFAVTPTDDTSGKGGLVIQANINARYCAVEWHRGAVYVAGGGGWVGFRDFASNEDVGSVNYGAGVEFELSRRASLLLEGRDNVWFNAYGSGMAHSPQVSVGISYRKRD